MKRNETIGERPNLARQKDKLSRLEPRLYARWSKQIEIVKDTDRYRMSPAIVYASAVRISMLILTGKRSPKVRVLYVGICMFIT
jgi:hypothetical protein